jgi:DNA-binding NtrC family response regulator
VAPRDEHELSTILSLSLATAGASAGRYRLSVIAGQDAGVSLEIDGAQPQRVLVGQSPVCALRLSDRQVSRRHLALEADARALRVMDLGSTNGTWVNGVLVSGASLGGGEVLRVGETEIRVELVAPDLPVPLSSELRFGRVVGSSPAMRKLYPLLKRIAATDVPVIVEGETGTGKELLAESIHEEGARASGAFVVFDCTAVAPTLIESTLFGHEKGAFSGAVATRRGVFEQADGGTLVIDEIGDLDVALQSKLLRAIERSEVQRVGGNKWIRVDVRVIAATRRDLDAEVAAQRFRDDLFFRLNVARVELPPLRARAGDVGVLARHFWRELGSDTTPLPADFLQRFDGYGWPGNVRELYNLVARRRAFGDLAVQEPRSRPSQPPLTTSAQSSADPVAAVLALDLPFIRARDRLLEEFERQYVKRALERYGGNVSRAAAASGIARRYFYDLKNRSQR